MINIQITVNKTQHRKQITDEQEPYQNSMEIEGLQKDKQIVFTQYILYNNLHIILGKRNM